LIEKILKVDKTRKIKAALIKGYSVINFPEDDTPTTIEFNFGSFAMARLAAVIPIAIDYKVKTDAFVDDDTFIIL
jgi:1-acyl-sn-glycerol-3-phosphate acyltransferase